MVLGGRHGTRRWSAVLAMLSVSVVVFFIAEPSAMGATTTTTATTAAPTTTTTTASTVPATTAAPATTVPATTAAPATTVPAAVAPPTNFPAGSTAPGSPPVIPAAGSAYLGAWLNPSGDGHASAEVDQLPTFNQSLGRGLSVVHIFQSWATPAPITMLQNVWADGGIPMIDWACGITDAAIVGGQADSFITAYAQQLAQIKQPLFLRWYWEPNLLNSPNNVKCLGTTGPDSGAAGYVAAFDHIHALFAAAGATNVAFVFASATNQFAHPPAPFYPGASDVDWVAADGYYRQAQTHGDPFAHVFRSWYAFANATGKPLMITETASLATSQAAYLRNMARDVPTEFPNIRGVLYFDSPRQNHKYTFPLSSTGAQEFQTISRLPLFLPARQPVTLTALTPKNPMHVGQTAMAKAVLSPDDLGGTVSFSDSSAPLAPCQLLRTRFLQACQLGIPALGTHTLTATYSGDAESSPATGSTLLSVVPLSTAINHFDPTRHVTAPANISRSASSFSLSAPAGMGAGASGATVPALAANGTFPVTAPGSAQRTPTVASANANAAAAPVPSQVNIEPSGAARPAPGMPLWSLGLVVVAAGLLAYVWMNRRVTRRLGTPESTSGAHFGGPSPDSAMHKEG